MKTWNELLKEWGPWMIIVLTAIIGAFKWGITKLKEESVGKTKVKEFEARFNSLEKRMDKTEAGCLGSEQDIQRLQTNQETIRNLIEGYFAKMQEWIMRGKL